MSTTAELKAELKAGQLQVTRYDAGFKDLPEVFNSVCVKCDGEATAFSTDEGFWTVCPTCKIGSYTDTGDDETHWEKFNE